MEQTFDKSVKVSVIIPVYNADKHIRQCAISLFSQTLSDMEFVFVDDASPDSSMKIVEHVIEDYVDRSSQVKILRHKHNEGSTKSRNDGAKIATGEYIVFCDADDFIEPDMYERLYSSAKESGADIAICDYFEEHSSNYSTVKTQNLPKNKGEIFNNLNTGALQGYLWNKLLRKDFFKSKSLDVPAEISLWDDMALITPLMLTANKIIKVDCPLYHYRVLNQGSITNNKNYVKRARSMLRAAEFVKNFLEEASLAEEFKDQMNCLTFRASLPLITKKSSCNPKLWRRINRISVRDVLNFTISWRAKVLAIMALLFMDPLIKILLYLKSDN